MGVQDNVGVYKTKVTNPTLTFEDLIPLNQNLRTDLPFRAPLPPEQAEEILKSSLEDQTDGILAELLSLEDLDNLCGPAPKWFTTIRVAIWQKLKYRMIDDASKGHNQTYGASEAIHTTSASASATLTRCFRQYLGRLRNAAAFKGSSRDMKKA